MPGSGGQRTSAEDAGASSISTGGSVARTRARRLALLALLAVVLVVLSYVAYYYSQNFALPVPRVVSDAQGIDPPQYMYSFSGTGVTSMTKPTGIGLSGDRVYVTDLGSRTVRAYTRSGDYLFDFAAIRDGARTRLDSPVHIAVAPDSTVWVTDRGLRAVYVFDRDGKYLRRFVPNGDKAFRWSPLAIAFSADGDVYISDVGDSSRHRVLRFGAGDKLKAKWGKTSPGSDGSDPPGAFHFPNGLAVSGTGSAGLVYVADGDNHRVQVFRTDGTFVQVIATSGTPRGLAVDAQRRLWVVDALAHRLDLYSSAGVPVTSFGGNGPSPGQFSFPNDVAIDADGRIFVTDRDNNQVQVWGFAVGAIPGITRITPETTRALLPWLALPVGLLALLLVVRALRPRRFVVTKDFVSGMVEAGMLPEMIGRRWRWLVSEADWSGYDGNAVGGIDLGGLLHGEPHSPTDAAIIRERFGTDDQTAAVLALARRSRVLCTEDLGLARLAVALDIDVYDRDAWIERYSVAGPLVDSPDGPHRAPRSHRRRRGA
jgi:sugar lactone lactonase YvrE